jgi:hypothetical protein
MSTKNPRLNVVLEPTLFSSLKKLAKMDGTSLSLKARDLIKEAMEFYEDSHWANHAAKREKSFNAKSALSHKEVWAR